MLRRSGARPAWPAASTLAILHPVAAIAVAAIAAASIVITVVAAGVAQWPAPDPAVFLDHVRTLASPAFAGRAPGTAGEEKTVAYLADRFRALGYEPAGEDGTYVQAVPLVGSTATLTPLVIRSAAATREFAVRDEVVAWTKRAVPETTLDRSEMVFVGYGVEAPEQPWDDYKGADLTGKTMVVLAGDPPVPDPDDPAKLDARLFAGPAMTWYGRWVYKYDAGAARKAAGVLIVHETGPAGYPFSIVQGRLSEQFDVRAADNNVGRPAVEGWVTLDAARAIFAMAGQDYDALKRSAVRREFRPVPLGLTASMTVRNALRPVDSRNVVARLPGSDPAVRDEHVVLTAHWDHFGHGSVIGGETIRPGAVDNATGVAGLLETARLLAGASPRPRRSILLLSVTAEEQGLLGSDYYVRHPLVPLEKTLAVLNFEMMNVHGRTRDAIVYGLGASDLDDRIREAAARQQRVVRPDPVAEQGLFYRSDHFPFARAGVPATWVGGGDDYLGKPAGYAQRVREEWLTNRYHKPADRVWPDWDLAGAMEDVRLYVEVAQAVADGARYPEWRPGAEFKAARDAMLRQGSGR